MRRGLYSKHVTAEDNHRQILQNTRAQSVASARVTLMRQYFLTLVF